jgi:hypothetical protein
MSEPSNTDKLTLVLKEVLNKKNFKKYSGTYLLVITFFLFIFLNMIFGKFADVLIIYLIIFSLYAIFKLMK